MKILSALVAAVRRLELPVPSGSKPAAEDGETRRRQRAERPGGAREQKEDPVQASSRRSKAHGATESS